MHYTVHFDFYVMIIERLSCVTKCKLIIATVVWGQNSTVIFLPKNQLIFCRFFNLKKRIQKSMYFDYI